MEKASSQLRKNKITTGMRAKVKKHAKVYYEQEAIIIKMMKEAPP